MQRSQILAMEREVKKPAPKKTEKTEKLKKTEKLDKIKPIVSFPDFFSAIFFFFILSCLCVECYNELPCFFK